MRSGKHDLDWALSQLQTLIGERCATGESVRRLHAGDESWHPAVLPDAVCWPVDVDEVAAVIGICSAASVPLVPFGTGSGMEGGANAVRGGISLDLGKLDRVLDVSTDDMDCVVEAGVRRLSLNRHLRDTGLFFPVDPGADASLGGMAATRASGPNAARHGTMRDNVLGLEAVLGTGEVVRFGGRARKSSAGYDLVRLLVGSEGTLGVITKLTLRLQPIPEAHRTSLVQGADGPTLIAFAVAFQQAGIAPSKIEFMDAAAIRAVRLRDPAVDLGEAPALLVELAGAPEAVESEAARAIDLAAGFEIPPMRWARTGEARAAVWRARHGVAHAEPLLRPGARSFVTDVAVPVSRLANCIAETRMDIDRSGFVASIVAHVADGNFHVSLLIDPAAPDEVERAETLHGRLVERALAMGGTCSGEHGIGIGKQAHLVSEVGPAGITLMRGIKQLFDPAGIMNPGKIFEAISLR